MKLGAVFSAVLIAMSIIFTAGCQQQPVSGGSGGEEGASAASEQMTPEQIAEEKARLEQRLAELDKQEAAAAAPAPATEHSHTAAEKPAPAKEHSHAAAEKPAPVEQVAPAEPAPPEPEVTPITLPAGTLIDIEVVTPLSSETSSVGDTFTARVADDVAIGELVALRAGTEIEGVVKSVQSAEKKIGGTAQLELDFDRVIFPDGSQEPLQMVFVAAGKKQSSKDAATIGGATAGGALLGRLLKKKHKSKGTLIGAIIGGAVGAAIAANNPGDPVQIDGGTVLPAQLEQPLNIDLIDGRPSAAR